MYGPSDASQTPGGTDADQTTFIREGGSVPDMLLSSDDDEVQRADTSLHSQRSFSRSGPVPSSTQQFVVIVPPSELPVEALPRSGGAPSHSRRGTLLPLYPTLGGQLYAIAREYGLPSVGGLSLYLVDDGSGTGGPRIGDATWSALWSGFFDENDDGLGGDVDEAPGRTAPLPYRGRAVPSPRRYTSAGSVRQVSRMTSNASLSSTRSVSTNAASFALETGRLPIAGRFEWAVDPARAKWWRPFLAHAEAVAESTSPRNASSSDAPPLPTAPRNVPRPLHLASHAQPLHLATDLPATDGPRSAPEPSGHRGAPRALPVPPGPPALHPGVHASYPRADDADDTPAKEPPAAEQPVTDSAARDRDAETPRDEPPSEPDRDEDDLVPTRTTSDEHDAAAKVTDALTHHEPQDEPRAATPPPAKPVHSMSATVASLSAVASRFFGQRTSEDPTKDRGDKPHTPPSPHVDIEQARERLQEKERQNANVRRHAQRASIDVPRSVKRASARFSEALAQADEDGRRPRTHGRSLSSAPTAAVRHEQAPLTEAPPLPPQTNAALSPSDAPPPPRRFHAQSESLRSPIVLGSTLPSDLPPADKRADDVARPDAPPLVAAAQLSRQNSLEFDHTLGELQRALELLSPRHKPRSRFVPQRSRLAPPESETSACAEDESVSVPNGTPAYVRYGIADISLSGDDELPDSVRKLEFTRVGDDTARGTATVAPPAAAPLMAPEDESFATAPLALNAAPGYREPASLPRASFDDSTRESTAPSMPRNAIAASAPRDSIAEVPRDSRDSTAGSVPRELARTVPSEAMAETSEVNAAPVPRESAAESVPRESAAESVPRESTWSMPRESHSDFMAHWANGSKPQGADSLSLPQPTADKAPRQDSVAPVSLPYAHHSTDAAPRVSTAASATLYLNDEAVPRHSTPHQSVYQSVPSMTDSPQGQRPVELREETSAPTAPYNVPHTASERPEPAPEAAPREPWPAPSFAPVQEAVPSAPQSDAATHPLNPFFTAPDAPHASYDGPRAGTDVTTSNGLSSKPELWEQLTRPQVAEPAQPQTAPAPSPPVNTASAWSEEATPVLGQGDGPWATQRDVRNHAQHPPRGTSFRELPPPLPPKENETTGQTQWLMNGDVGEAADLDTEPERLENVLQSMSPRNVQAPAFLNADDGEWAQWSNEAAALAQGGGDGHAPNVPPESGRTTPPPSTEPLAVSSMSPMSPDVRRGAGRSVSERADATSPQSGARTFLSKMSPKFKWPSRKKRGEDKKERVTSGVTSPVPMPMGHAPPAPIPAPDAPGDSDASLRDSPSTRFPRRFTRTVVRSSDSSMGGSAPTDAHGAGAARPLGMSGVNMSMPSLAPPSDALRSPFSADIDAFPSCASTTGVGSDVGSIGGGSGPMAHEGASPRLPGDGVASPPVTSPVIDTLPRFPAAPGFSPNVPSSEFPPATAPHGNVEAPALEPDVNVARLSANLAEAPSVLQTGGAPSAPDAPGFPPGATSGPPPAWHERLDAAQDAMHGAPPAAPYHHT